MNADSLDEHRVEFKYQLEPALAAEVRAWAKQHLAADEHCDPSQGDSYDIHTLYLDTETWDLYHRTHAIGKSKHRVRRYGHSDTLWLETKRKNNESVVTKRRFALPASQWLQHMKHASQQSMQYASQLSMEQADQQRMDQGDSSHTWDGQWFQERIRERGLRPAINVHYKRFARMLNRGRQAIRLTIDSHLAASLPRSDWNVIAPACDSRLSLGSLEILELKFNGVMPELFKRFLQTFPLQATGFSKFRSAVAGYGLAAETQPVLRIDSPHATSSPAAIPGAPASLVAQPTLGESA